MADDALKTELTAQLARSRSLLSRNLGRLKEDLDVPAQVKRSFMNHRTSWIGGAALFGWALSRLRKAGEPDCSQEKPVSHSAPKKASPLLPSVARILFQAARPAITAFATQKISGITASRR